MGMKNNPFFTGRTILTQRYGEVNNFFLYFLGILLYNGGKRKVKETERMKRIMSVDYGDARTGIAVSDLLCSIVGTTTVIHSRNAEKTISQICDMVRSSDVGEIVVGLPKNMDGTEGARAELCRGFAEKLQEATGLPVTLWDERRTTVEAHNILSQHNYHGQKRKNTVDAVAAALILEGYLAFRSKN